MKKIIVGILPTTNLNMKDDPYDDYYKFIDMYGKKIFESNGIPMGILLNNGALNYSSLELCDAFLIQGGNKVEKFVYETIYYCIKKNKPLLGICNGAQALAIFSAIFEQMDKNKNYEIDEIMNIYQNLKKEYDGSLLRKIDEPNIHFNIVNRTNIDTSRHDIEIKKGSLLYSIYNKDKMSVTSLHSYDFKYVGEDFIITATSEDGVAEAIEYKDKNYFILGVQPHPELEYDNLIFKRLIKEAERRNENV